ncbi:unnamed protein product [Adineta steineri]|uniref:Antistasin-like domain-containing protein n=1 Tax=Adineta steineri TaxID=433720 RepID=A0A814CAL4_9BILA|nr:unnamed protein product [Adineta steineri]CAF1060139.1 unnamed protein product [Adineta steineri]CAF1109496.1 unnamed protein product [Adineta steineri]
MHRFTIVFLLCTILFVAFAVGKNATCSFPRCRMACPYGYKSGKDGCAICSCKKTQCVGDQIPLEGYFCGRGVNHRDCPKTHKCVIEPQDRYAVCCPRRRRQ